MLLRSIWILSLVLAAVSLAVMAALILVRVAGAGRARREEERRTAVLTAVLSWLDGATADEEVKALLARDCDLSASLLIEVFEVVRGEGQMRLANLAEEAGIVRRLREKLARGRRADRVSAAEALVWFGSEETCAALRGGLLDRDDDVSFAAATALADLGEELPSDAGFAARLDRSANSLRLEMVLNRLARRQPGDLLRIADDESRTDRVRIAAIQALTDAGAFEQFEGIAALAASPSVKIRSAVARSLGASGNPDGQDRIAQLLRDRSPEVRAEAAEAAGRLGALAFGEELCVLVHDDDWWVRHRAAEALAKLGDGGIAALQELASGATKAAETAAHILAGRGRAAA